MSTVQVCCTLICMKKHKYLPVLLLLVGVAFPLTGAPTALPYGIGVQFSPSIWGLSYNQQFDLHAVQATAGISYDPNPLWETVLSYQVALDYQRNLYRNDFNEYLGARLYATTTLAHAGEVESDSGSSGSFMAKVILGVGFGVEVTFFENFSLPVEVAYEFSYTPTEANARRSCALDLVPRIGLRFRFS